MPLQTQAKILRVLTDKQFTKVGGVKLLTLNAGLFAPRYKILKR